MNRRNRHINTHSSPAEADKKKKMLWIIGGLVVILGIFYMFSSPDMGHTVDNSREQYMVNPNNLNTP